MASSTAESDMEPESLRKLFQEGMELYNYVDSTPEPLNTPAVQSEVKKAIQLLEQTTRMVSLAGLFSHNENIDEVATEDLQYMLLPALLGALTSRIICVDRRAAVNVSEIYYKDFLQRTNEYGLSNYIFKEDTTVAAPSSRQGTSELDNLRHMVNTRADKIQKFREQKELKEKLADIKKNMDNEHADEEVKRSYFISMVRLFVYQAVDELSNIEMEKPILEHMANLKKDEKPRKGPPPKPLKPIIITKDAVQKAVYGAGYPSLPIMTVQEFYDKRVLDGVFPDPNKASAGPLSLQQAALSGVDVNNTDLEDEDKEKQEESDDAVLLARLREKDEFHDDHRRGWGNRMNRS